MLKLGAKQEEIKVVDNQYGCPTAAADLAECLLTLSEKVLSFPPEQLQNFPWGIYHFAGRGQVSWAKFAEEIFAQAQKRGLLKHRPRVIPISSADYPLPARRPACSALDCTKITTTFGISPRPWPKMLDDVLTALPPLPQNH
jgi:dTDP-4-dehydrorhamnose reductase